MNDAQATTSLVPQKRKACDDISQAHGPSGWEEVHMISASVKKRSEHAAKDHDQARATISIDAKAMIAVVELSSDHHDAEEFENSGYLWDEDVDDNDSTDLEDYVHYVSVENDSRFTTEDLDEAHLAILEEEAAVDMAAQEHAKTRGASYQWQNGGFNTGFDYVAYSADDLDDMQIAILEEEEAIRAAPGREWDVAQELIENGDQDIISTSYDHNTYSFGPPTKDDTYFNTRIQSDSLQLSSPTYQKALCEVCRVVNWSALERMTLSKRRLVFTRRGSPLELRMLPCRLCKFLGEIGSGRVNAADSLDGMMEFKLSLSASGEGDTKVLIVSLNGEMERSLLTIHSMVSDERWNPRMINPESVDYAALKRMFFQCRDSHNKTCQPKLGIRLPGFKVIHCKNRKVVSAPPTCKYVALSYVWGKSSESDDDDFPVTVEDSIRVTEKMGFRYLWVDRHCINQRDKNEKHRFIQNMDEIYAQAQLTIVAAAGKNPHYGLPGIGSRPRSLLCHIKIGNVKLVQLLRPGSDFQKSPWWQRAWTYQEGVLSCRKLVFTDHQVFYVCNKVHSAESLNVHAGIASFHDPVAFSEMVLPTGPRAYVSYLKTISMRALSHQSDALNTCLGILKATKTQHIWGVPIEIDSASGTGDLALCWRHSCTTERRSEFPSWSWAGWDGGIDLENCIATSSIVSVLLGDGHQDWQSLHSFCLKGQAKRLAGVWNAPKLLKMTGSILDAALLNGQWPNIADFGTSAGIQQDERPRPQFSLSFGGTSALCALYMDKKMEGKKQLHDVIAMRVRLGNEDCCVSALLLKPHGNYYTRVGMINLTCENRPCKSCSESHIFWEQMAPKRTVIVE